jgi:hypothetical protein
MAAVEDLPMPWTLLWHIPPGVCVALVGFEALIITLVIVVIPPEEAKRPAWIMVAGVLGILLTYCEITIIRHDRKETFAQHEKDMADIALRIANVDVDILAMQNNFRAQSFIPHPDSLRTKTLSLSNEILRFLVSREIPPGFGQGGFGEGSFGGKPTDTKAYDQQTIEMYAAVFEPRVSEIVAQLKQRGVTDEELSKELSHPVNTYSIRDTAERLTALAEKLPATA